MKKLPPYEIIGNIAIVEASKEEALLYANDFLSFPYIKSVFIKKGPVSGELRTRDYEYVAGINNTETIHKEHGLKFLLDINKVYFSPRLSEERKRVALQVKDNEKIAVLFGGIAPYALVIWKYNKEKNLDIICVEINKDACYYAQKNVEINKARNIKIICDDVKNIKNYKEYESWADRIIAPFPKDIISFFEEIKYIGKNNAIVHAYIFASNEKEATEKLKDLGQHFFVKKCGSYSKEISRFVVDLILKK